MEEKGNYVTISGGGRHNATIKVFMVNASQQWFRWTICRGVDPDDKSHVELMQSSVILGLMDLTLTATHTLMLDPGYNLLSYNNQDVFILCTVLLRQVNGMPHEGHQIVVHRNKMEFTIAMGFRYFPYNQALGGHRSSYSSDKINQKKYRSCCRWINK
ncbi:hypothetical protein C5167_034503 [Papaver somniferum]|uniref:Uncharacterized protein n=1 Tax=Papaver somniferum TaxID=3469 RepID=A0A4Y7KG29_PAPSO|nr:hypothetical protein C5167_034503 [Papaver somniferum]